MKKTVIFLLFIIVLPMSAMSQQRAGYSNFLLNNYYFSPAIAGSKNVHEANIAYRNQWAGFDGAPTLIMANFQGSVKNNAKNGYSVSAISERKGLTQSATIYINYAQHFRLSEKIKLGLGVQPGYMQYRVRLYDAQLADAGDEVLSGTVYSANALDLSAGFHLYSDKFFVIGTMHRILGRQIQFTSYNSNLAYHIDGIAGYNFNIKTKSKKIFQLQPSVLVRYAKPVPLQVVGMLKGTYDDKYWLGFLYRSSDAIGVSAGIKIKERLTIGYGYDYTISRLSKYQSGSHEVMLSFVITKKKPSLEEEDEKLNNSILEELQNEVKQKKD